jgi:hypothetical protein
MVTFVADGEVIVCGFVFSGSSFIRVIGFIIDSEVGACTIQNGCVEISGNASYLEFWHNTIRNGRESGIRCVTNGVINNSLIIGNTFYNFGIGNGSGMAVATIGANNLIAYNEVYNSHPDGFLMYAANTRWLNNYTHDFSEASGGHSDVFQTGSNNIGWRYNLIESNFQVGVGNTGNEHTAQISHAQAQYCSGSCGDMTENIFRHNVWHNVSEGTLGINQTDIGTITYTRYYHNTTADACKNTVNQLTRYGLAWYGAGTHNSYIHNNIEYDSWGDSATSNLMVYYVTGGLIADNNLAYDPNGNVTFVLPWTSQSNPQSNVNPQFVDYTNDDFHLQANSGAIGRGGPLTWTSGSGTGTTFNVVANGGGFFRGDDPNLSQYGGNLVVGDLIKVGIHTVRIASISGDAITAIAPFTWANGEPVYYGASTTPDIGAYPYMAGGNDLRATYSVSGGAVTVVPSAPNLVRFVVCYEDGIPTTVVNSSPYTCSVGTGSMDVRVYPLYASKTLYIRATLGEPDDISRPSPPANLRIVQ